MDEFSERLTDLIRNEDPDVWHQGLEAAMSLGMSGEDILNMIGFDAQCQHIPAGSFTFQKGEVDATKVDVQEFYMAQTEVTEGQWYALMGGDPPSRRDRNLPKTEVNWHDCNNFCEKLGAILGCEVGLPHEVEWEYAARGGQDYTYAGSNNPDEVAWYSDNSGNRTHPVGQKKPNGYGLYDMSGNVWEWCQNAYGAVADAVDSYYKLVGKTRSNPRRRRTRRTRRR